MSVSSAASTPEVKKKQRFFPPPGMRLQRMFSKPKHVARFKSDDDAVGNSRKHHRWRKWKMRFIIPFSAPILGGDQGCLMHSHRKRLICGRGRTMAPPGLFS
ncbi:hypothetical protein SESBI_17737 [Sesbania bispinosa]|nr:hypothetical protein SESBI_17737 [Sesbania bispinosa]